jgi:transposase
MQVLYARCAGLDVHKKTVVACIWITAQDGTATKHSQTFGTMTPQVLALCDWLKSYGVTHVAMESTGVYWKPIYNLLEGNFELLVVNAQHVKAVPGRKTDVNDAEWIGDLLRHGLLRGSFVPPQAQRELRELTRHRSIVVGRRRQAINERQKALESTNIKLASVVSDITGMSATAMLQALLAGQTDPRILSELALGRLRKKKEQLQQALQGVVRPHQKLILSQLLADVEFFDEQIAEMSTEIEARVKQDQEIIDRMDEIPGINQRVVEIVVAELGTDMSRFATEGHVVSWSGLCPGKDQSGGKRRNTRSRKGSPALRRALVDAAQAAAHTHDTYLSAMYHRLAGKRGKKRAIVAVARTILVTVYHMMKRGSRYEDLGADYFDRRNPSKLIQRLTYRIKKLGYEVTVTPLAQAA